MLCRRFSAGRGTFSQKIQNNVKMAKSYYILLKGVEANNFVVIPAI